MIDLFPVLLSVLPIFLYAETHYRFRYFFSLLRKREPEILADAPHRIDPHQPVPILIFVKDAHQFPVVIDTIKVFVTQKGNPVYETTLIASPLHITSKYWWKVFELRIDGVSGSFECDVIFTISHGKKQITYRNDNHRTSTHRPLSVFVSPDPLPKFDDLYLGECHSHSSYTEDQVEFGSPIEASAQLSHSLGLSFFCVTDHSYDLDDLPDNYLMNDPSVTKWRTLLDEIDRHNSSHTNVLIIRGEEVSCRNSKGQNVHLLLLGLTKFIPGSGDSAERWFKRSSKYSVQDILQDHSNHMVSLAAHPKESVSLLQRLLLNRGQWTRQDLHHPDLTGIQFANGNLSNGFSTGYQIWIEALLHDKKIFAIAGNDAHGNFNRFRQIGIPFLKIREANYQLFGKMRTGVFAPSLTEKSALYAIQSGKMIITDGPIANLIADIGVSTISSLGDCIKGTKTSISLEVRSSSEYGSIDSIKLFKGTIGDSESILVSEATHLEYNYNLKFSFEWQSKCYIRAEVWTSASNSYDNQSHFCITNPIWFQPIN